MPTATGQYWRAEGADGVSFPTAAKAMDHLVALGIARETTGGRRNRLFAYDAYLAILSEDGEPLG